MEICSEPADPALRKWFAPLLAQGSGFVAPNLVTRLAFLRTPHGELPLSINEAEWENSYVLSPWTHYITCGAEETGRLDNRWLRAVGAAVLAGLGKWLRRARFNRVVMVNNWLLSTNPWPSWPAGQMREIVAALVKAYPGHAILFRSLNAVESAGLMAELAAAGARLVPSRQVWHYAPDSALVAGSPMYRKDLGLLYDAAFRVRRNAQLAAADFPRLAELYRQLYIEKYSASNPQFTAGWLQHLWEQGLVEFTALLDDDDVYVGVEGACVINGVLTSPVVGYDTALPRSLGLYRRLAVLPIKAARDRGLPLNLSAGVGQYKALRGGTPVMEFLAVYDRHLHASQRWPWTVISAVSRHVMAPLVQRLRL